MKIGQKEAKSANKLNTEFFIGVIKDLRISQRTQKALVDFNRHGNKWVNISNLEIVK